MTDSSNTDHWGSLASDLGAKPTAEPPARHAPPKPPEEAAQVAKPAVAQSPPMLETFSAPAADEADNEPAGLPPIAAPIPDFFEAVRLERERAEAIQRAEWPLRLPDEGIDLAHDAGESFRTSREQPLEFSEDIHPSTDAESFESETVDGRSEDGGASEEKSGRRRRRRRGRRGGKSGRDDARRDEARRDDARRDDARRDDARRDDARRDDATRQPTEKRPTESKAAVDFPNNSHDLDAADDFDDDDAEHAALYATDDEADSGDDSPKHRNIPTWPEAIGMIVDTNLAARSTSPSADRGRGRGRGGRRRGRGGSK